MSKAARIALLCLLALAICSPEVECKKRKSSRIGHQDKDLRSKRVECDQLLNREDADPECTKSVTARDNCMLKCTSEKCYNAIYGDDPLEEGEIDTVRGGRFRTCARSDLRDQMASPTYLSLTPEELREAENS
eukprot:jgi/Mesvir1/8613/Mv04945-RA.1